MVICIVLINEHTLSQLSESQQSMSNSQTSTQPLKKVRRSIFPLSDDNWDSIAIRELPDMPLSEAVGLLQSYNLHVYMRPSAPIDSPRAGNPLLPGDVIFLEAPQG